MAAPDDRLRDSLKSVLEELLPNYRLLAFNRYTVTSCDYEAQTFDGTPSITTAGLPNVSDVPIRLPIKVNITPGTSVLVGFAGGVATDPFLAFPDQLTTYTTAKLRATGQIEIGEAATQGAVRQGDMVLSGGVGTQCMLSVSPTGDQSPQPVTTMTPLFLSFGSVAGLPPTFPIQGQLTGITSTASALVTVAGWLILLSGHALPLLHWST